MSTLHLLAGIAAISLPALAQAPPAQRPLHLSTSFDFVVQAPRAMAAPLFGPEGERAWAGDAKHFHDQRQKRRECGGHMRRGASVKRSERVGESAGGLKRQRNIPVFLVSRDRGSRVVGNPESNQAERHEQKGRQRE